MKVVDTRDDQAVMEEEEAILYARSEVGLWIFKEFRAEGIRFCSPS